MPPKKKQKAVSTHASQPLQRKFRYDPSRSSPLLLLPYQVLVEIFLYAATNEKTIHSWPSSDFLLKFALLNRHFTAPALTALYSYPALFPPNRAVGFFKAVKDRPDLAGRVRNLIFEVEPLLVKRRAGEKFELLEALASIPKLEHLAFQHTVDPYKQRGGVDWGVSPVRWKYPEGLFETLDQNGIRLRTWRWEANFAAGIKAGVFAQWEGSAPLSTLRSLEYSGFGKYHSPHPKPKHFPPTLRSLTIERCDTKWELPETLRVLRVEENSWLRPEHLPRGLRELRAKEVLHLDGQFLCQVADLLPDLQILCLSPKTSDRNVEYLPPNLPTSLHTLEIYHLNLSTKEEATAFGNALLLPHVPNLLYATIDIGVSELDWRDRASFRTEWIDKISKRNLRRLSVNIGSRAGGQVKFREEDFQERVPVLGYKVERKRAGSGRKGGTKRRKAQNEESEDGDDDDDDDDYEDDDGGDND